MKYLPAALIAGLLFPAAAFAASPPAVKSETLLAATGSWDGHAYKDYPAGHPELTVLKITIPAHTKLAWHEHPEPSAAYILSGTLTIQKRDGEKKIVRAGQAVAETMNTVHRGVTGATPVVLLAFYAGAKGLPVTEPAP